MVVTAVVRVASLIVVGWLYSSVFLGSLLVVLVVVMGCCSGGGSMGSRVLVLVLVA